MDKLRQTSFKYPIQLLDRLYALPIEGYPRETIQSIVADCLDHGLKRRETIAARRKSKKGAK